MQIYTVSLFYLFYAKFLYLSVIHVPECLPSDANNICQVLFVLFLSLVEQVSCFIFTVVVNLYEKRQNQKKVLCSGSRSW